MVDARADDCVIVVAPGPRRELDGTLVAACAAFRDRCKEARLILLDPDRRLSARLLEGLGKPARIGAPRGHLPADPEIGTPYLWLTRATRILDLWLRHARPARVVAVDLTGALFYPALAKRHGLAHGGTAIEAIRLGPHEEVLARQFLHPTSADLAAAHMARETAAAADRIWTPALEPGDQTPPLDGPLDLVAVLGSNDPIAADWSARVAKALAAARPKERLRLVLARPGAKPSAAQWQEASKLLAGSGVALTAEPLRPNQPRAFVLVPWQGPDGAVLAGSGAPLGVKADRARETPWSLPPAPLEAAAAIAARLDREVPAARLTFESERPVRAAPAPRGEPPRVSVCLVHFNRPALLTHAIESLERQSYEGPLECLIVDDGSTSDEARAALARLERELPAARWRVLRKTNGYPGAARNFGAAAASGDYLLFVDDDNTAKPHMVETLVAAARAGGADIVTCLCDAFNRLDGADRPVAYGERLFLGNALGLGALANVFGDVNALIRRETFEKLGGFTEDYAVGCEDWEFFLRAALAGVDLQVIPESLFHYRVAPGSITDTTSMARNVSRVARALLAHQPDGLGALAAYAQPRLMKLPTGEEE